MVNLTPDKMRHKATNLTSSFFLQKKWIKAKDWPNSNRIFWLIYIFLTSEKVSQSKKFIVWKDISFSFYLLLKEY